MYCNGMPCMGINPNTHYKIIVSSIHRAYLLCLRWFDWATSVLIFILLPADLVIICRSRAPSSLFNKYIGKKEKASKFTVLVEGTSSESSTLIIMQATHLFWEQDCNLDTISWWCHLQTTTCPLQWSRSVVTGFKPIASTAFRLSWMQCTASTVSLYRMQMCITEGKNEEYNDRYSVP